jgi:prophage regulatory protein
MADTVRMLRLPEVEEITGLSGTTIWRHEREGRFPRRRRLGSTLVAWRSDEVQEWIESLPAAELEPAS